MTGLPLRFALRYLFARKSYNVINLISGIGVAGMALGTAALVMILSVFNGFSSLVDSSLTDAHPDLSIRPATGKFFLPEGEAFTWALASEDVLRLSSVLEEQAFLSYEGRQSLAQVKGIDAAAEEESALQDHLTDGVWQLHRGQLPMAVAGTGLAYQLGLSPRFVTPLEIHYPARDGSISLANPAASLRSVKVRAAGLLSVNAQLDNRLLLVPIELMRELLDCPEEVSAIEIWTAPGKEKTVRKALESRLGAQYRVLDRQQQDLSLYRMMRVEKLSIFLILLFVVLIVAFNIYSSLKMLVIEKQHDLGTLRSLGAPEALLRQIFLLEGWLMSLLGMVIGLVLGVGLVLLQQRYGLVSMPGNFVVSAYPVVLKASDLVATVLGVAGIGFVMAFIPSRQP